MPTIPLLPSRGILSVLVSVIALLVLGAATLAGQTLDRNVRPATTVQPPLKLPPIEMRTLANGIPVAVMRDTRLPMVSVSVVLDINLAVDPVGKTGLGAFTEALLNEGTTHRTADQIADAAAALGGGVGATDFYNIKANLDSALALMADQLLNPAFPQPALDRHKANTIANLRRQMEDPNYLAGAVFGRIVYGAQHPYARQQTEQSVSAITRDDLLAFHAQYVRPPNVRFVVVGDITPDEAVAKLTRHFGAWQSGTSARVEIPAAASSGRTTVYLYDRPGSAQSVIRIGALGPRRDTPDYHAITLMNTILGGSFSSRVNLNLRERHGYTYGAGSSFTFRRVPEVGAFVASAAVQTAKTDSAVIEFMRELRDIRNARPVTPEEFAFALGRLTRRLPLQFEGIRQRATAIRGLLSDNLPLDYYDHLSAKVAAVTRDQAQATAKTYIDPDHLAIVIAGDRKTIEAGLRAANIAPVTVVDLDGKPVN